MTISESFSAGLQSASQAFNAASQSSHSTGSGNGSGHGVDIAGIVIGSVGAAMFCFLACACFKLRKECCMETEFHEFDSEMRPVAPQRNLFIELLELTGIIDDNSSRRHSNRIQRNETRIV